MSPVQTVRNRPGHQASTGANTRAAGRKAQEAVARFEAAGKAGTARQCSTATEESPHKPDPQPPQEPEPSQRGRVSEALDDNRGLPARSAFSPSPEGEGLCVSVSFRDKSERPNKLLVSLEIRKVLAIFHSLL